MSVAAKVPLGGRLFYTVHPFLVLDGEVECRCPQLVVWVLGLKHGLQQWKLRLFKVQETLLAVD